MTDDAIIVAARAVYERAQALGLGDLIDPEGGGDLTIAAILARVALDAARAVEVTP